MSKSTKKVNIGGALDWPALELSESVKGIEIPVEDGFLQGSLNLSQPLLYNPETKSFQLQRVPTRFFSFDGITDTANLWTPAAGKRFRLMGGSICIAKETACAGALLISIRDTLAAVNFINFRISAAALVATGQVIYLPIILPPNGYLCTLPNSLLQILFSAALTAGSVAVNMWGCEE